MANSLEPFEIKRYFVLKSGRAVVFAEEGLLGFYFRGSGANAPVLSLFLAKALTKLAEANQREIDRYQDAAGSYWAPYPRARATVEYLQQAGLLKYKGKPVEIEDVGPPYEEFVFNASDYPDDAFF